MLVCVICFLCSPSVLADSCMQADTCMQTFIFPSLCSRHGEAHPDMNCIYLPCSYVCVHTHSRTHTHMCVWVYVYVCYIRIQSLMHFHSLETMVEYARTRAFLANLAQARTPIISRRCTLPCQYQERGFL